jgi:hypothetical protein
LATTSWGTVQVHRVHLQALVVVVHEDPVALLGHDRLGGGEALAVERSADGAGVVEHHRDLLGDLEVLGDLHAADGAARGQGTSPIWMMPSMPLGTLIWPWWWAWYMPTAFSTAVNS